MSTALTAAQAEGLWLSVFGAMVAIQVRDHMRAGHNGPDEHEMGGFVEEAEAVADMAVAAHAETLAERAEDMQAVGR